MKRSIMPYGKDEMAWIRGSRLMADAYDRAVESGMDEDDIVRFVYEKATRKTGFQTTATRESRYELVLRPRPHSTEPPVCVADRQALHPTTAPCADNGCNPAHCAAPSPGPSSIPGGSPLSGEVRKTEFQEEAIPARQLPAGSGKSPLDIQEPVALKLLLELLSHTACPCTIHIYTPPLPFREARPRAYRAHTQNPQKHHRKTCSPPGYFENKRTGETTQGGNIIILDPQYKGAFGGYSEPPEGTEGHDGGGS